MMSLYQEIPKSTLSRWLIYYVGYQTGMNHIHYSLYRCSWRR